MLGSALGALGGLLSFAQAIMKWLSFKRTKEIGRLEGEIERRRVEDKRARRRRAKEAAIRSLDRDAVIRRLRGGAKKPDRS